MSSEVGTNDTRVERDGCETLAPQLLGQACSEKHVCSLALAVSAPLVIKLALLLPR